MLILYYYFYKKTIRIILKFKFINYIEIIFYKLHEIISYLLTPIN